MHTSVYPIQMRFNKYANQLQTLVIVSFLLTTSVCKGPFTKDVRAEGGGGGGGLENQDKLGHRGGGGGLAIRMSEI
jgi:hypothetical protein